MSTFEIVVLTYLVGHTFKQFTKNEILLKAIDGFLVGILFTYLFIVTVLA